MTGTIDVTACCGENLQKGAAEIKTREWLQNQRRGEINLKSNKFNIHKRQVQLKMCPCSQAPAWFDMKTQSLTNNLNNVLIFN